LSDIYLFSLYNKTDKKVGIYYFILIYYIMDFTDFIIKKIQKSNYSYDKGYMQILNNIIYIICIRLLILMVQLTNHCNRNVIKKDAVHYASKIELKNIDYSPSLI